MACVRWSLSLADSETVRTISEREVQWDRFLELTQANGLTPMAADCIRLCECKIPPETGAELDRLRRQNTKRFLVFSGALSKIAQEAAKDGIRLAALKGPALAATYPDPSWRAFGDLDFLVAPEDVDRAVACLERIGYRSVESETMQRSRRDYRAWEFELPLEQRDLGIHADLHWRLLPGGFPAQLPAAEFLERSKTIDLDGTPVCVLEAADQLLFLSAHGAKHGWSSLDLMVDVRRAVEGLRRGEMEAAICRAREYGASKMLNFALKSAESLTVAIGSGGPIAENSIRMPLALSDTLRARVVFLAGRIFVPKPAEWASLPVRWRGFYALHFPWRLMRTGWKLLIRGLP